MSHRITAGADILLMPSKFEPCGLNQLYAMRYGTVPVVHATGGLIDTVKPYSDSAAPDDDAIGTGFLFSPANSDAMMGALNAAMRLYREKPERWRALMRAGMRRDSSWLAVAARYEQIFEWAKLGASIGNALPLLACAHACAFPFAFRRPAVLRLGRAPAGCCIGV